MLSHGCLRRLLALVRLAKRIVYLQTKTFKNFRAGRLPVLTQELNASDLYPVMRVFLAKTPCLRPHPGLR